MQSTHDYRLAVTSSTLKASHTLALFYALFKAAMIKEHVLMYAQGERVRFHALRRTGYMVLAPYF